MEPLVLPLLEFVRGLTGVAGMTIAGAALIVVGMVATVLSRRLQRTTSTLALTEDGAAAPHPRGETDVAAKPTHVAMLHQRSASQVATIRLALRCLGFMGLMCAGTLTAFEYCGAEPLLRWSLSKLQTRTGVSLTVGKVTGGPLRGEFVLQQVRAVRENHPHSNFDIAASRVTIRFAIWKLVGSSLRFDEVRAEQVTGSYHRVGVAPAGTEPSSAAPQTKRPAKNIPIGHLEIRDATIDYVDSTVEGEPVETSLGINTLTCAPFRTAYAPYDVIFRSNVDGSLDQHPFQIRSTTTSTGRQTEWVGKEIPVRLAQAYLKGPFRWLSDGEVDVRVVQDFPHEAGKPVTLETLLTLRDIRAGVPENVKPAVAIAVRLLMSRIKSFPKQKDLRFKINLDPEKFDLTKTEDQERLWQQFREAAVAALLQSTGIASEGLSEETNQKVNRSANIIADEALKAIEKIKARRKAKKAEKEKAKSAMP